MQSNNPPPNVTIVLECLECGGGTTSPRDGARISSPTPTVCSSSALPAQRGSSAAGTSYRGPVLAEVAAAALICLDPGHGTAPGIGMQLEPIGPGRGS